MTRLRARTVRPPAFAPHLVQRPRRKLPTSPASSRPRRPHPDPVGFQNSATGLDLGFYAARSYSLIRSPRTGLCLICPRERSANGWSGRGGWSWRLRVGATPVVMGRVLGQDRPQVPFAEDQHLVGDLGPGRAHESFRVTVRPRTPGRDLHGLDTGIGQDRVKRRGELPGPVPDQEPEASGTVPGSISRLRIC